MTPVPNSTLLLVALVALAFWQSWSLHRIKASLADEGRKVAALAERLAAVEALVRPPSPANADRPTVTRRVDPPEDSAIPSPTLISVPNLAARGEGREPADADTGIARRYGGLWELADSGASPSTIARATGLPVGRVELVLGLRRRPPGPPSSDQVESPG